MEYRIGQRVDADTGVGCFLGTIVSIDSTFAVPTYEVVYDDHVGHGTHTANELHLASMDYPEFGDEIESHPSPEKLVSNAFGRTASLHTADMADDGDSGAFSTDLGSLHNTDVSTYPADTKCALCNLAPVEFDVDHIPVCGTCAESRFGIETGAAPVRFGQTTAAMNTPDEIPPAIGDSPIPEGHVRLFHHTWARNIPSIRQHGLLAEMGHGDGGKGYGNEPSAGVWASTQHDAPEAEGDRHVVEFHAHPSEIGVGEPYNQDVHEWNRGNHNVLMKGSVKPENIVAIHDPWHTAYHQIADDPRTRQDTLSGRHDGLLDDPEYAHSYGRAIKKVKAEHQSGFNSEHVGMAHEAVAYNGDHVFRFHPANPNSMGGVPHHTVEAWSPEHADTEWAKARPEDRSQYAGSEIDPGTRPVGSIGWSHKTGEIRGVFVDKDYQRQGLATELLNRAKDAAGSVRGVKPPKHSPNRTNSGNEWAKSTGDRLPRKFEGSLHLAMNGPIDTSWVEPEPHLNKDGSPHSSVMVALPVPEHVANGLAEQFPNGEDPREMHMTIAYLGKADDVDPDALHEAIKSTAYLAPKSASVGGYGTFEIDPEHNDGFPYVHIALVDAPGMDEYRHALLQALEQRGMHASTEHGFTPHISLQYAHEPLEGNVEGTGAPWPVDSVVGAHGSQWRHYPVPHPMEHTAAAHREWSQPFVKGSEVMPSSNWCPCPASHDHLRGDYTQQRDLYGNSKPQESYPYALERTSVKENHRTASAPEGQQTYYHITSNPHFSPDPNRTPEDNSITLSRMMGPERKGLYVTQNPERWVNGHNYVRPYIAEIHAHPQHVDGGEYSGEGFIHGENLDKTHLNRVMPLDAHAREEYGEHGWIESHHGTTFDTGEKVLDHYDKGWSPGHMRGYHYNGPDVRDMSPGQHAQHKERWLSYMKENRRFDDEDIDYLRHEAVRHIAEQGDDATKRITDAIYGPRTDDEISNRPRQSLLPRSDEMYGGYIHEHPSGHLHVTDSTGEESRPLKKLYRVVHPAEWEQAQTQGYLQSQPPGHMPYTRASAKPDERWRSQSADPTEVGARGHTLEIDYHPEDGWRASSEGYAATHKPIPLHRVRKVSNEHTGSSDLQYGYHEAPQRHHQDIMSHGLRAGKGGEGPDGPYAPGVYFAHSVTDLKEYTGESDPHQNIYRINLRGVRHQPDPDYSGASYSPEDIDPSHISHVGHTDETGKIHWHNNEHTAANSENHPGALTLYRGLSFGEGSDEDIEHLHRDPVGYMNKNIHPQKRAGIHWTEDYQSAHNFATNRDAFGYASESFGDEYEDEPQGREHGVVLEAKVHPRHVLDPDSEEGQAYRDMNAILPGSAENESTVRGDSRVHIHKIHAVSGATEDDPSPWDKITTHEVKQHRLASEDEAAPVYYHGTSKVPSWKPSILTPAAHRPGSKVTFPSDTSPDHVYATTNVSDAWDYAEKAWNATSIGVPRVFRVRPTGPVETDPITDEHGNRRGNWSSDVRSKHSMDVVGEEKMPEHMGEPEDWREAVHHEAMAWTLMGGMDADQAGARPVGKAGFKGYVGRSDYDDLDEDEDHHDGFDEHLWEKHRPEPTPEEHAHYKEHGEYPDSHMERHDEAYSDAMDKKEEENTPDHIDDHLHHWIVEHSGDSDEWTRHAAQPQNIDLRNGVHATQSHVGQFHIDRYLHGDTSSWHSQQGGNANGYLGEQHPLFVTHEGRLHAIEGHHRIAAALQRGDSHIEGWHHDLDAHPVGHDYEGKDCEDCKAHHDYQSNRFEGSLKEAGDNNDGVRPIPAEDFHQKFESAMKNNSFTHHVSHHSTDEIKSHGMIPLASNGGDTGVLVHHHGDGRVEATGLYNTSNVKGAGVNLLKHAVDSHGVNYVEAYGPQLPKLYEKVGFKTREQHSWDYDKFGTPDYHVMGRDGSSDYRNIKMSNSEEQRWDDPNWVADLRREIEADCVARDPLHVPLSDVAWEDMLKVFGV